MTKLTDLERNDVEAALAYVRKRDGKVSPDEGQMLLMLQDDPTELMEALRRDSRERKG